MVDKNLLDWAFYHHDCTDEIKHALEGRLLMDRDGEVFIHYLADELMDSHERLIRRSLQIGHETDSESIVSKAHWMIDYHQYVASAQHLVGLDGGIAMRFQELTGYS